MLKWANVGFINKLNMNINKGDKFLCVRDFIMSDGTVAYERGKIYTSDESSCITDEQGNTGHIMKDTRDDLNLIFKFVGSDDNVNHPSHYTHGSIECIDAMVAAFGKKEVTNYCKINAFKYLWRADLKGKTLEDLKKAQWYLLKAIELSE